MDKSTIGGICLALTGIGIGLVLEGGRMVQMLQPTAALIVFGGTVGAVMIQFPLPIFLEAVRQIKQVFSHREGNEALLVEQILQYAAIARKKGMLSLDDYVGDIVDPFLKKSLMLAIDGTEPNELRDLMDLELCLQAENEDQIPRVFEAAGGFAPTIGIIGAVLGLIQVMQRLQNIDEVGKGIAVAFVATIYGVGSANILFLPFAGKLKIRMREKQRIREMTLDAVISILEGINPRVLESRLGGYVGAASLSESALPAVHQPAEKMAFQ